MKSPMVPVCVAIALLGCEPAQVNSGPGTLIYRTGVTTTCENIVEIDPAAYARKLAFTYKCQQADGEFLVSGADLSGVKYLTKPKP